MTRQESNRVELEKGKFRLDIRKKFFTMKVMRHTNRLFREVAVAVLLKSGLGFQQPDLVKNIPPMAGELG